MSKNILENWIDQNSKRLSDLSGKNKPLYDSVFDALLYLNNYLGGEEITTKIPEKTPENTLRENQAIDLTTTKIMTYNNEYTELFLRYIFENDVPLPSTVNSIQEAIDKYSGYSYWYVSVTYDVGFFANRTSFLDSNFKEISLTKLGLIPHFVRFSATDTIGNKKIAVDSVQEARELIDMLKRCEFWGLEPNATMYSEFYAYFGNRTLSAIAKDEFFYFAPLQDGVQIVITDNSRRDFDNSSYQEMSFLSFKELFNKKLEEQYPDELVANQPQKSSVIEIGDWVRLIDDNWNNASVYAKYGDLGEVVDFDDPADPDEALIVWLNTELQTEIGWFTIDRFELAYSQPKPLFKIGDIVQWKEDKPTFSVKKGATAMIKAYTLTDDEMYVTISWLNTPSNNKLVNKQKDGGYSEDYFEAVIQPTTQPKTLSSITDFRIGVMGKDNDGDIVVVGIKDKPDGSIEEFWNATPILQELFKLIAFGYYDDETFDFEINRTNFYLRFRYIYDQDSIIEWKTNDDRFWFNKEGSIDEIWNYIDENLSLYIDEYAEIITETKKLFEKLKKLQLKNLLRTKNWQPTANDPTPTQKPRKTKGIGATGKKPKTTKIVDKNLITLPKKDEEEVDDLLDDIENLEF
jgi:hypothetical protein